MVQSARQDAASPSISRATRGDATLAALAEIPRCFHYIWLGSDLPESHARYMLSWRMHHPDWKIVQWSDGAKTLLPDYLRELYEEPDRYVPNAGNNIYQFQSDILRLGIIYKHGGVYLDTDFVFLKPIDDLIEGDIPFATYEDTKGNVSNAIFAFPSGHEFIKELMPALYSRAKFMAHSSKRANSISGPALWTLAIEAMASKYQIKMMPPTAFYPYLWSELHRSGEDFTGSYAVHHWNNMRNRKGRPLP